MRFPIGFGLLLFAAVTFLPAKSGSLQAPASITVDGHVQDLTHGRYFLYFFDPSCDTSFDVAKNLATLKWKGDVQVIGVVTRAPEQAAGWMAAGDSGTGLQKPVSTDAEKLRAVFKFDFPPHAVLLENGKATRILTIDDFDQIQPENHIKILRQAGAVE